MLRVKTGRKRLKTSTTCECFFEKIEEFSIPSRGIATHGSHASGRWLGVLASVLKSRGRCGSHMKAWRYMMADRLFSSFLDFETWHVIHFSISMEPGVPSAILLEMQNLSIPIHWRQGTSPKGLQFSQRIGGENPVQCSDQQHINQCCSRQEWFDLWSLCMDRHLYHPIVIMTVPCFSFCRQFCHKVFVPTIRPSDHPGSQHAATLNSRLPSARSPQSVSRTMRSRCHLQLMSTGNSRKGHLFCRSIVVSGCFTTWKIR